MTNCSLCANPTTPDTLSYLSEPLCQECADAERDDGTDEAIVEAWARKNAALGCVYYVKLDDLVYVVWPGDGRDWTAVPLDKPLDELEIVELEKVTK